MIRLLGALLMLAGSACWGFSGVLRLNRRAKALAALTGAVGVIKSEVCDRLSPVPEVLVTLINRADRPADAFFRRVYKKLPKLGKNTFPELWRQAAEESPELCLKETEMTALYALGNALGRYGADEQGRELDYIARRFEGFLTDAEAERKRDAGMHAALGVAAGVFCVIILL